MTQYPKPYLTTAPVPVVYIGISSSGSNRAQSQQRAHNTALCHTPAHTTCNAGARSTLEWGATPRFVISVASVWHSKKLSLLMVADDLVLQLIRVLQCQCLLEQAATKRCEQARVGWSDVC